MNWCQKKLTVYVKITVCKYCLSAPRFKNFMSKETCTHKKKEEKFWLSTNRNFNTSDKCQSYRIINTVWCYNFKFFVRHWVCSTFRNFRNPSKLYPWWPKGLANFNIWDVKKKIKYWQISIVYVVKSVFYIS